MIAFLIVVLLVTLGVVAACVIVANDPDWLRVRAKIDCDLHAARRSRQLSELRRAMRRDAGQLRDELDDEFRNSQ